MPRYLYVRRVSTVVPALPALLDKMCVCVYLANGNGSGQSYILVPTLLPPVQGQLKITTWVVSGRTNNRKPYSCCHPIV